MCPRWPMVVMVLLCLWSAHGCGSPTNREAFIADQEGTVTPHGPINLDSVADTEEGVTYQTRDGRNWHVRIETRSDGRRSYGEPQSAPP